MLLENGADLHAEMGASRNKKTALMVACAAGDLDIVKLLVSHEARVEKKGVGAL